MGHVTCYRNKLRLSLRRAQVGLSWRSACILLANATVEDEKHQLRQSTPSACSPPWWASWVATATCVGGWRRRRACTHLPGPTTTTLPAAAAVLHPHGAVIV